jgi:hypothetical protein
MSDILPVIHLARDGETAWSQASMRKSRAWRLLFLLPDGEGQGEGIRQFDSHRVSPILRTHL